MKFQNLHEEAARLSKNYFKAEAELLDILQRIDAVKAYRDLGCTSLYQYAVNILRLSESTAFNFINVARKAVQIPELKNEIEKGNLSVSKARKIVPVLNQSDSKENQKEWIEKAKTLNSRKLEQAVAKAAPKEETPESSKFVTETRRAVKLGMEETDFQNLKRVQDLESQRQRRTVSMEEAIAVLSKFYLEAKDPLLKAKRAAEKMQKKTSLVAPNVPIQASSRGHVNSCNQVRDAVNESVFTSSKESTRSKVTPNVFQKPKPVMGQWEAALETPPDFFLELHLPLSNNSDLKLLTPFIKRTPIPARELHPVRLRDQAQCTHINSGNKRCDQRRWLEIHHVKPVSEGGGNEASNLTTLCFSHHRQEH